MKPETPYYRLYIGRDPKYDSKRKASSAGEAEVWQKEESELQASEDAVQAHSVSLTVEETMASAPVFKLSLKDPDMEYMFDENLYLGRYMFFDLGYPSCNKRKIDGFIKDMSYSFGMDGIPTLDVEGNGAIWEVLTKEARLHNAIFTDEAGKTLKDALEEICTRTGLQPLKYGTDAPSNIDEALFGRKPTKDKPFLIPPAMGLYTDWAYLSAVAKFLGCWFIPVGRSFRFYPPWFVNAPVDSQSRLTELNKLIKTIEDKAVKTSDDEQQLLSYRTERNSILREMKELSQKQTLYVPAEATSFWYRMDNPKVPGAGYNLLSFKPRLTSLNFSGYFATGMNPETGHIVMGDASDSKQIGQIAKNMDKATVAGISDVTNPTVDRLGANKQVIPGDEPTQLKKMATDKSVSSDVTAAGKEPKVSLQEGLSAPFNSRPKVGHAGGTEEQMTSLANFSFRTNMWFTEATATVIGHPDISCGQLCYIGGLGRRRKDGSVAHNEKLCGRWYIFAVTHNISNSGAYTCDLTLKRYWQMENPLSKSDEDKMAEEAMSMKKLLSADPQEVIGDIAVPANKDMPMPTSIKAARDLINGGQ